MSPNKKHRKPNKKHKDRVARLGCIACMEMGYEDSPSEIHHLRDGQGLGQRATDEETLPLCPTHAYMIHHKQKQFRAQFGTERELLAKVRRLLGLPYEDVDSADDEVE